MQVRPVSIALSPETLKIVDEAAKREGRTRSQYIRRIIELHLKSEPQPSQEPRRISTPKPEEVAFKMG